MVRDDLIASAVSFLQDPSVASSPVEKRIAFLQSKNLTQEEIDISLARAEDASGQQNPASAPPPPNSQQNYGYAGPQMMRQPGYGYGPYQGEPWGPPPELPARDWRDWFIMATVTSGVGYGLYVVAKRYIMPLIAPPTPPQLEQDKTAIDASFARAFALIDQLAADTATLKASEAERTEKLDSTLKDVDAVIADLKAARTRQENESRSLAEQVTGLKDLVPKALEGWRESGDRRLEELGGELRSLKKLLSNRVSGPSPSPSRPYSAASAERNNSSNTPTGTSSSVSNGLPSSRTAESDDKSSISSIPSAPAPGVTVPRGGTPGFLQSGGKAVIPAWQMAASGGGGSKKAESSGGEGSITGAGT